MAELGELERNHAEFSRRDCRIVAVSMDNVEDSGKTQKDFPHLAIVADKGKNLISALKVNSSTPNPTGEDVAAPTTMVIDKQGMVRWIFRPDRFLDRLGSAELLEATDKSLGVKTGSR